MIKEMMKDDEGVRSPVSSPIAPSVTAIWTLVFAIDIVLPNSILLSAVFLIVDV
jgi:hypothetical protein